MILRPRETSTARRAPKWLLAVLVVSLLLNGLIVGAVASRWHKGPPAGPPALGSSSNSQLYGFAVTLPNDRWRHVQKAVEGDRAAVRELRQTVHAIRDEARKILVAEPFDASSYAATQKRLHDAEQTMRLRAIDMVTAIAQQLTPAERAAFARWEEDDRSRRRAFWRGMREKDEQGYVRGSTTGK